MSSRVAIDVMGGDLGPKECIKGVVAALKKYDFVAILVGDKDIIEKELKNYKIEEGKVEIVGSNSVIENCEQPTVAIKQKKDSSMVMALKLVKEKSADAVISSGNTGALLAGGTVIVGRTKGVLRPFLGAIVPTEEGFTILADSGANIDAKPEHLLQFGKISSIYYKNMLNVENPTVALLNIGAEKEKGNELTKATYQLLEDSNLNFIGNIEARDFPQGVANIVLTEAFVGNIALKLYEGTAKSLTNMLKKSLMSKFTYKLGALLSKGAFKDLKKTLDYREVGGVPFLGLKGLVIKAHGSSDAYAYENAIKQAIKFVENDIVNKIDLEINGETIAD